MKILATIESVEITRKVQHADGSWGNVYGITLASGDDRILAERFTSDEGLKRAGIVAGAVGNVQLDFNVNRGTSRAGNPYCIQNIRLVRFDLSNRNLNNGTAAPATDKTQEVNLTELPPQPAQAPEQVKAEAEAAVEQAKVEGTDLPF